MGTEAVLCPECDAPILWCLTVPADKRIPIDRAPVRGGNVLLVQAGEQLLAIVLGKSQTERIARNESVRTYVAHFTTCPKASLKRRRPAGNQQPRRSR